MSIYIHREGKLIPLAGREYSSLPIATILPFAGNTVPDEFLLCDGSEFDVTKYPDLYSALGRNTTPDLRGRFLEGRTASQAMLTNIAAGLPNITGAVTAWGGGTSSNGALTTTSYGNWASSNASSGGAVKLNVNFNASNSNSIYGNSSTVQPPATVVDYIIKATPSMSADVSKFVTSGYIQNQLTLSDYENIANEFSASKLTYTAPYDGIFAIQPTVRATMLIYVNDIPVAGGLSEASYETFWAANCQVRKDDVIRLSQWRDVFKIYFAGYKLRDYSSR